MANKLDHRQIQKMVNALSDGKIVNLDSSIKSLIGPIASSIGDLNPQDKVSFHVLCCDEYFLVTGLQVDNFVDVENVAGNIRSATK